jgi:DoxX-like family
MPTSTELLLGRCSIAGIWLFQGFWCKVLGRVPRHARVIEASPLFDARGAHVFLVALGWFETLLAVLVLCGAYSHATAIVQIALLLAMNTGGLIWARKIIPDPAGMLFHNFAFAVLIWICA